MFKTFNTYLVFSFVGDGRWRTVIRRCSSVTESGVTNVCNWGIDPNGVYWEECYCTSDGCNGSAATTASFLVVATSVLALVFIRQFWAWFLDLMEIEWRQLNTITFAQKFSWSRLCIKYVTRVLMKKVKQNNVK